MQIMQIATVVTALDLHHAPSVPPPSQPLYIHMQRASGVGEWQAKRVEGTQAVQSRHARTNDTRSAALSCRMQQPVNRVL